MSRAAGSGRAQRPLIEAVAERIVIARGVAERRVRDEDLATLQGAVVLVTGAGGSIGSGLVEALLAAGVAARVVAFDHDDTRLQRLLRAVDDARLSPWLGDVRDAAGVAAAMAAHGPQLVIHCAAVKHSDLVQRCPREALRTNVLGTSVVAAAASRVGARLVNVSTDKAATATSVLGASKRLAEHLVAAAGRAAPAVSVRLGNVIDSRGSAVEAFVARATCGMPLPITDLQMTRLWTTTREVVTLVLHAAATAVRGGCIVMPLGRPVSVGEVAEAVCAAIGAAVGLDVIGARPGDAQHEVLQGPGERAVACCACGWRRVEIAAWQDDAALARWRELPDHALGAALCLAVAAPGASTTGVS